MTKTTKCMLLTTAGFLVCGGARASETAPTPKGYTYEFNDELMNSDVHTGHVPIIKVWGIGWRDG